MSLDSAFPIRLHDSTVPIRLHVHSAKTQISLGMLISLCCLLEDALNPLLPTFA